MSEPDNVKTIREAFREASSFLAERGVLEAPHAAELLLLFWLDWEKSELLANWSERFPHERQAEWQALLARRATGEPVQHIIGTQDFYGVTLKVNRNVLIPRPETELLVEQVLWRAEKLGLQPSIVVDIGTGSGAIPISLAKKRHHWRFMAVDLSMEALAVARENAQSNAVAEQIEFLHGDGLTGFTGKKIDILISNPPYIPSAEIAGLQREVRDFEPLLALDGGADGLDIYRCLVQQIHILAAPPKLVAFEVGHNQSADVAKILSEIYLSDNVEIVKDLAGIERMVFAVYS